MASIFRLLLLALPLSSYAAPGPIKCAHKVKESVAPPRGWVQGDPAPADHILELRIALPQPQFGTLEAHLYEISDPYHERYGQHLTKDQVEELVAPHPDSIAIVDEWLVSHGLNEDEFIRSPAKDWVTLRVPVDTAEEMLGTVSKAPTYNYPATFSTYHNRLNLRYQKYHVWTHEESGDSAIRTLVYSLPEDVHEHIELIQPTTMFARMKGAEDDFPLVETSPTNYHISQCFKR